MGKKIVIDIEITSEGLYQIISKDSTIIESKCESIGEILDKALINEQVQNRIVKQ
jgi:hypothetical protein